MMATPIPAPTSPARVILVDDDPAVTRAIEFSFGLEGLQVSAFPDAAHLLDSPGLSEAGCLILDYQLPDMDGLHLLARLREDGVTAPAILITSNPKRVLRQQAAEAGAPIIEKPLLSDALLDSVKRALGTA